MAVATLARAERHRPLAAASRTIEVGMQVLTWREKIVESRIGEWLGSFTVVHVDNESKLAYVRDVKIGPCKPFNFAQVKPYYAQKT